MFIKNDPTGEQKFFNGKIGEITDIGPAFIKVTCKDEDNPIHVTRYSWENTKFALNEVTNEIEENTIGTFEQYPVRLAWAITVHKSQGLTFENAILDLDASFAPGQMYVALSRLTSLKGLILSSKFPNTGLKKNIAVETFSQSKKSLEELSKELASDKKTYVFSYCKQVYDFSPLLNDLVAYLKTFDKDEKKSVKQQYRSFHQELLGKFRPLKEVADKFVLQMNHILGQETGDELVLLQERMTKAQKYFTPLIDTLITELTEHREKVKTQKSVKAYLKELKELTASFYKHEIKTNKASLLLKSALNNEVLTKDELQKSSIYKERKEALDKQEKEVKISTKEISFNMHKEGLTIEDIAEKRGLVPGTIEGHLSHYVSTGDIDIQSIMTTEKIKTITKVIKEVKDGGSADVKALLGDDFSYGEIKMVKAHLDLQNV